MATKETTKVVKAELQDLSSVLREIAVSKEGCFYEYRPKGYVGAKIYTEMLKRYEADNKSFVFSDDLPESGLLSQAQALSSVVSVLENLAINPKSKEALIKNMINDLLERTKADSGKYRIDASPYLTNSDIFEDIPYMDGITWIISAILGLIRLHIKGAYTLSDDQLDAIVPLYSFCLKSINDSFIESENTKRKFNCGWNFTTGCEEPSLYFTFAVSELLIDILNTFENVIRSADVELIQRSIREELDKGNLLSSEKYLRNKDKIERALKEANENESIEGVEGALNSFSEFTPEEKLLISEIYLKDRFIEEQCAENTTKIEKNSAEIQREIKFFKLLNNNCAPYDTNSPYKKLEECCKKSANKIWELTKENLASEFYSSNLESTVSTDSIESSVSSDAVFNVIFAINTIINSGLDEDYEDRINYFTINGDKHYNEAISNYDNMRDTIHLAYENCYQFLMRLKKENKDYKISEYTLNFDETFVKHASIVKEMRKAHIRVFSLMPLMIRTKTVIGEFLIQYPQYDMILFLEQILMYRCWDKANKNYLWIWENDGYSTSSNYYFITALSSFYDYYETYENAFRKNANNNRTAKKEIEEKYHKALRESGKAVDKDLSEFESMQKKIADLNEQIATLNQKVEEYENDPLRSALSDFVTNIIKEVIVNILSEKLSNEATRIISSTKERVLERAEVLRSEAEIDDIKIDSWAQLKSKRSGIEKGMGDIMMAMLAEQLGEAIYSVKPTNDDREKALDNIHKYVVRTDKDMKQAMRYYLQGIADEKKSNFVANCGESTLSGADHRTLMRIIEEKQTNKGDID